MSAAVAALFSIRGKPRLALCSRAMASSATNGSVRPTSGRCGADTELIQPDPSEPADSGWRCADPRRRYVQLDITPLMSPAELCRGPFWTSLQEEETEGGS